MDGVFRRFLMKILFKKLMDNVSLSLHSLSYNLEKL